MRKRSAAEISFRLRQELGNVSKLVLKPSLPGSIDVPAPLGLPDGGWAAKKVTGSLYASEVTRLADEILAHRFPLLGFVIETGPSIDWRKDYIHDRTSSADYFRFVKYLDFNAVGDHKIIWEFNRHQHLVLLAQAYRITGKKDYYNEILSQINSWLEQNPFERGINWASALEVAFRALSWMWIYHMTGREFTLEFRRAFLTALYRHGCFLENNLSVYFSPNTHLLGEAVALHALGVLFPQFPRSARWRDMGGEFTRAQMHTQVRSDGSHFEQSSYYQVYAADMFLLHLVLDPDVPLAYKDRLIKMMDYIDALLGPQRAMSFFGDDDGGRLFHPYGAKASFGRATLATAAMLLNRDYDYDEADVHEQAVWWLSPRVLKEQGGKRRNSDAQFPDAGVSMASRDETRVVFKWGGFGHGGAGHSHADVLSITVRRGDEELLIDPGTYTYMESAADRDWFRSVSAHNTVRVDGMNQATPENPFRWGEKPQVVAVDPWTAIVNYGGISHRRHVDLSRAGLIVITDQIEGPSGEHFVEQFWHAGVEVKMLTPACFQFGSTARLHLQPGTSRDWEFGGEFGWRSPGYGVKEASPVVRASLRGALPMTVVAVLDLEGAFEEWPL